jgi:hypothetical protein
MSLSLNRKSLVNADLPNIDGGAFPIVGIVGIGRLLTGISLWTNLAPQAEMSIIRFLGRCRSIRKA